MIEKSLKILFLFGLIIQSLSQNYVPQPIRLTTCPDGGRLINYGNNNFAATTSPTSSISSGLLATFIFNATEVTEIRQLSLGLNDNLNIASVVRLRLGIWLVDKTLSRLGQTEEINVYPTAADIVFGNLESPVTVQPGVTYAISAWADGSLVTGAYSTASPAYSVSYTTNGYPYTTQYSQSNARPLAATGCVAGTDPYSSGDNQLYAVCGIFQGVVPAPALTSYSYARSTITTTFSGILAVAKTGGGSSPTGNWLPARAGFMSVVRTNNGNSYSAIVNSAAKGTILASGNDRRLYTTGASRVDNNGLSFVSSDGTIYSISYANNSYVVVEQSSGSLSRTVSSIASFTITAVNSVSEVGSCTPTPSYIPDTITCDAGEVPVSFGDDDPQDAQYTYSNPGTYAMYGNFMFFREFTANTPNTVLKQLTFLVNSNPNSVVKLRMAIFTASASAAELPTYTLLEETREVTLTNIPATTLAINLLKPINLVLGTNYTIAVISDQWLYTSYSYHLPAPWYYSLPYEATMKPGFPTSVKVAGTAYVLPMAAKACVRQQTTKRVQFCASFHYADPTTVLSPPSSIITTYSGVLTLLASPQSSPVGDFYTVISGTGSTVTLTTANVRAVGNWTVHSYYQSVNNRFYVPGANGGIPLDQNGIGLVVNNRIVGTVSSGAYGVQLASWFDPASGGLEYTESQQRYTATGVTYLKNMVSDFTYSDYNGGEVMACNPPPRPRNLVSPASAARVICPNNENSIADVYGDINVGEYANHADGTTIQANKIYTQSFTSENTARAQQLALGILKNVDRVGTIAVRLGLYSVQNNSLMVQTTQLVLLEAVDQLIIMNLPYPVTVEAGKSYLIALHANATLEVATTATPNSPSMDVAFTSSGLPTTFTSSGNAVSVSVALFGCVSTTHSFCSYYQYYVSASGSSVTLIYQGLIQTDSSRRQENAYGAFVPIYAMAGRLTQYTRTSSTPTNSLALYPFTIRAGGSPKLYVQSSNGYALDTTGVTLDMSNGGSSTLLYDANIKKMDESFRSGADRESDIIFSGFSFQSLESGQGIPSCGLASIPKSTPDAPAPPSCPADQELVMYGDADAADTVNNQEGIYYAPAPQIFLRQFTSHETRASVIHQVKFQINRNYNTVSKTKFGLYNANFTFMAGSRDQTMYNPDNQMFTGVLDTPQYLAPNTVYYLAWWIENAVYAGFSSISGPAGTYAWDATWPTTFVNNVPNSQRALAGVACTTNQAPPPPPPGSEPTSSSSSSNSNLSGGAVAGVVIGCVIGTNLLLLACIWLCCFGAGASSKPTSWKHSHSELEESRTAEPSRVELGEVNTS